MQQANNLIALVQAAQQAGIRIKSEPRQQEHFNESTLKLVILLFTRLSDLFGAKCKTRGILIYASEHDEEHGIYTDTLKLWYRKLSDLTPDQFKAGMSALEFRAEQAYAKGEEMWPPSYAEFRALCYPHVDHDTQAHKILPSVFDPKYSHLYLEDQTAKAKRYELGQRESAKLLAMFGDEPAKKNYSDEHSARQFEKAKALLAAKQL